MPPFPTTPIATLSSHNGPVHALAFSAGSGRYLLTGSSDRQVRLFNPSTAKLIQTYSAHGYEVLDLAVSDDNSRFVSVGGDKTVFVWDVATATTVRRFVGHVGRVETCAFGGEGDSVVVSGSWDGRVGVWDLRARGERAMMWFGEARDAVSCVRVVGGEMFAGSVDGRVRVYDVRTGVVDGDVVGGSVVSVCPTRGGEAYLVSVLGGTGRLMDRPSGKCLQSFRAEEYRNETYRVRSVLGMNDGVVLAGSEDGAVVVWDVESGGMTQRLWHREGGGEGVGGGKGSEKKDVVAAVAWNQARGMWASAGGDGRVVVWGSGE